MRYETDPSESQGVEFFPSASETDKNLTEPRFVAFSSDGEDWMTDLGSVEIKLTGEAAMLRCAVPAPKGCGRVGGELVFEHELKSDDISERFDEWVGEALDSGVPTAGMQKIKSAALEKIRLGDERYTFHLAKIEVVNRWRKVRTTIDHSGYNSIIESESGTIADLLYITYSGKPVIIRWTGSFVDSASPLLEDTHKLWAVGAKAKEEWDRVLNLREEGFVVSTEDL